MRYYLRDVLWLTVVVALGVGWWASQYCQKLGLLDAMRFDGDVAEADVSAVKEGDNYRVSITYGDGRGENGDLSGSFPGGHTTYVLTKQSEIVNAIGGGADPDGSRDVDVAGRLGGRVR